MQKVKTKIKAVRIEKEKNPLYYDAIELE